MGGFGPPPGSPFAGGQMGAANGLPFAGVPPELRDRALAVDEPFTWVQALGGLLVISGVLLVSVKRS